MKELYSIFSTFFVDVESIDLFFCYITNDKSLYKTDPRQFFSDVDQIAVSDNL